MKINKSFEGSPSRFYDDFYDQVNWCQGFGSRIVKNIHHKMESSFDGQHFSACLELGGGNGQHLDYVLHKFDKYTLLDLRKANLPSRWTTDSRIQTVVANAEGIPFANNSFDRVIVTCFLHHVDNVENVLNELDRVLKPSGAATIFIPCDPGLFVRITRRLTTQRRATQLGFENYGLYIAREHRGHFASIIRIAQYVLRERSVKICWSPLPFRTWNLNGYVILSVNH